MLKFFTIIFAAAHMAICAQAVQFGNDSIRITWNDKKGKLVIHEPHKINMGGFRLPEAPADKKARKETDPVSLSNLNYRLLDSLVWAECNKYRAAKGLKAVSWNDTIYRGSSHHSEYQAYYNFLAHGEQDTLPGRLEDMKHYEYIYQFEICLMRHFEDGQITYSQLAKDIIAQWKASPGHNKIMITPMYTSNSFGTAMRYDMLSHFTRENLLKYNPDLLKRIEDRSPDYFKHSRTSKITVWATGNFMQGSVKSSMDFKKKAVKKVHPDGTVSYSTSGEDLKKKQEELKKKREEEEKKKKKKKKK